MADRSCDWRFAMTSLTITPNAQNKKLAIAGVAAIGEPIAVVVKDFASESTVDLHLRVIFQGRVIATFPMRADDEWDTSGDDLTCVLDLNTDVARMLCRAPENCCLFTLEDTGHADPDTRRLWAIGEHELRGWPLDGVAAHPYPLSKIPSLIQTWGAWISEWRDEVSNLDITAEQTRTGCRIVITRKDGEETAVTLTNGQDGQPGADGTSAIVTVGQVSTLPPGSPATVENVGTPTEAVFNFGIPKGEKGDDAELDNNVTQTSSNGVKSSGIWTWVKGLLNVLTPADIGAVAVVPGKQLSTNDYTNAEKTKLAGIEAGAEVNPTPVAPSTEIDEGAVADAKKVAEFVNSSINAMAAFYITKNAAGDSFATKAELTAAIASGTFYNGGALRTPTKNDYLYVLADESATPIIPGVAPTTRYSYDGAQWAFQIVVNNTALTSAQVAAIDSGITAALVTWLSTFKGSDTATTLASVLSSIAAKYTKPSGGIPSTDLDSEVVNFLHMAETALHDSTANFAPVPYVVYSVGDFVKYNGDLYVCKTATTGGTFVSSCWTAMPNVSALFGSGNTALAALLSGKLDKVGDANYGTKVFWDSDGMTLKVKGNLRVNPDGDFTGLYVPDMQDFDDKLVWNIGQIRGEVENYSWDWSAIDNTPTTVDGYGITDASKTSDFSPSTPASYVTNFVQKLVTILAPNFSEFTSYAVGNFCTRMAAASPKIYQCTTAHTGAWNAAHFAERDVSALFTIANTQLKQTIIDVAGEKVNIGVTAVTQDGVTVTGQTVFVHNGTSADDPVVASIAYNGQPVTLTVDKGIQYFVRISDTLAMHFNPTTASGYATADVSVTLTYADVSTVTDLNDIAPALAAINNLATARNLLVGKEFPDVWVDYDGSGSGDATPAQVDNKPAWNDPLILTDVQMVEDASGNTHLGAVLMRKYATRYDIVFDAPNTEEATESTAQEGLYYYGLAKGATAPAAGNVTYLDLTAGDAIPYADYEKVYRNTLLESFNVTTKIVADNNIFRYGHNRYETSAYRQYLNSDSPKDGWWTKQHIGQAKPSSASSYSGYMRGCSAKLLSLIRPVKRRCIPNYVTDGGSSSDQSVGLYTVCDNFFLPCCGEMFGSSNDNEVFFNEEYNYQYTYWRWRADDPDLAPSDNRADINGIRPVKRISSKTGNAVYARLRSANRGNSCSAWHLTTGGSLGNYYYSASTAIASVPACVIY